MSPPQNTKKTHDIVDARESLAKQVQQDFYFAMKLHGKFLNDIKKHQSLENWIDSTIANTRKALNTYSNLPATEDVKKTSLRSGLKAILNRKHHEPRIDASGKDLEACHSSLLAAITILSQFELADIANYMAARKAQENNRACSMPPRALKP
ncbi:hypothetical protein FANTH_3546 [Fusarium anthophilum]|uniref:Uncharacterized protein n=1 Tax=Fusarium anthophilum TaxID=48485 RepID=A0A8H4ZRF6_9HYPO|nr:hypothetical protein FANTH_3546 [Fusarium anthophilum]